MSLVLLFHYLLLNMFRMLIHPSSGACDLFVELLHGLYCSVKREVDALVYLFSGECLVVTCVVPLEQTSSASACIRIPHHHKATLTHIEPSMCKLIYKTSEYVQETLSKTYHTQRKLHNHKTPHQPTFTETRFHKQPRTCHD